MRIIHTITAVGLALFFLIGTVGAADLKGAKGTVDNIRQADPPKVSTTTKQSPVGQPVSDYKPTGPSVRAKEPPPPSRSYNPQNDPRVEKGYKDHQKAHGR